MVHKLIIMETNKRSLMKHFAAVLRKRALATTEINEPVNPQILKFFTRKDLIQIITDTHNGTIPKQHNLMEMENQELLALIGDDMFIISYMTRKWCQQQANQKVSQTVTSQKKKSNDKNPKTSK